MTHVERSDAAREALPGSQCCCCCVQWRGVAESNPERNTNRSVSFKMSIPNAKATVLLSEINITPGGNKKQLPSQGEPLGPFCSSPELFRQLTSTLPSPGAGRMSTWHVQEESDKFSFKWIDPLSALSKTLPKIARPANSPLNTVSPHSQPKALPTTT